MGDRSAMSRGWLGEGRGGRPVPVHPQEGGSLSHPGRSVRGQAEGCSERQEAWSWRQVPAGLQRDLCWGRGGQGRLHWRWRVSSRLSGSVWQVAVVGLVSWGIGCASDLPGVYVDIAHYRDWINAN